MRPLSPVLAHRVALQRGIAAAMLLGAFLLPLRAAGQSSLSGLPTRSAELEVSLGAFDDSVQAFSRISGLTVDAAGRLYVLQSMEGQVTVLEPDGRLHQRMGRKGQGPGEFLSPSGMGWRGDTLWVMDVAQSRLSWFHQGQHVRTERFVPVQRRRGERIAAQWPMADGSLFSLLTRNFQQPPGHPDNHFPIVRTSADGDSEKTVAALRESFPFRVTVHHSEGTSRLAPFMSDFPFQSMGDLGTRMAIVDRPFTAVDEATIQLTVLGAPGDTLLSREYEIEAVPLTDEQWDTRLREALAGVDLPNRPYGRREVEAALPRPEHWPSATRVVIGPDHSIWVALADLPWQTEREWAVLDEKGVPQFRVNLPRRFRLFTVSGDVLWGVWRDELDVPHVQRYRIDAGDRR